MAGAAFLAFLALSEAEGDATRAGFFFEAVGTLAETGVVGGALGDDPSTERVPALSGEPGALSLPALRSVGFFLAPPTIGLVLKRR
jgi:hypothetical protein